VTSRKSQFDDDWQQATSAYDSMIAELESNYTTAEARIKDDASDRVEEWGSTQDIKCMLKAYQAGGTFDDATMNDCKGKVETSHLVIDYPGLPARVTWDLAAFPTLTDYKPFEKECHAEEAADEDADQNCSLVDTPAAPTCDKSASDDGPVWTLSAAGASFVH